MHEAYSHEVCSCGYWPGAKGEGLFYSYAYPEPPGYREMVITRDKASFSDALAEFVLACEVVRNAADFDAVALEFQLPSYDTAADRVRSDRLPFEPPLP
jgi:hypothetical protein